MLNHYRKVAEKHKKAKTILHNASLETALTGVDVVASIPLGSIVGLVEISSVVTSLQ